MTKSEKGVTDESTFEPQYYQVMYTGKGEGGKAIYDANGELIHSKEIIKDEVLPEAILNKIAEKYPEHKIMAVRESLPL